MIHHRRIYHSVLATFLAFLLVNAFVLKELHLWVDDEHHHHHHEVEISHTDQCANTLHFHEVEHAMDCWICHFNFSPTKEMASTAWDLCPPAVVQLNHFYLNTCFFNSAQPFPSLRAPPTTLA